MSRNPRALSNQKIAG